ncbi:hypothetical protein BJD99_05680 [Rhodococcus sp. 1163]|uniref:hypothetical protein n=1 Tax=unclassified Rhodococcus (in: high G+C Gram-positive bacteria) TaxID=192944 RepID=UPI000A002BF1|nr:MULTISPECIES: hypothetical protein [unclassified Rhodococcus (in: high G+C Gram-positive bacteria)]ORI14610.1 hypothetical protein BJD99_05680 [Rhodococcus sp. 1163]QCB49888.1 hypothetical protein E5769_06265 [Rhodococcus sp. PAMC28705]QCB58419.1 hypothetical protein E5720_07750 [Rhodococcus sp. PAMC28707]
MSRYDDLVSKVLHGILEIDDWLSIADVLLLMGTSSGDADRSDVRLILDCVNNSDLLKLGRVSDKYDEIPKPVPVEALLDHIFETTDSSDRSGLMMALFLADV